ncbi:MAG: hypothetical protein ACXVEF_18060 [Polyangiales bacterium]
MKSACCAVDNVCSADPACASLQACLVTCARDDAACTATCRHQHPDGVGEGSAHVTSCLADHCRAACGVTCGGYAYHDAKCASCGRSSCCGDESACMRDLECAELLACEQHCDPYDGPCLGECERAHPSAREAARAFVACIEDRCPADCTPTRWRCLVDPTPPAAAPPMLPRLEILFALSAYIDRTALAGVSVRACGIMDRDCASPQSKTAVTDASGVATLTIEQSVFSGYFELTGATIAPALLFVDELRSEQYFARPFLTPSDLTVLASSIVPQQPDKGALAITAYDCSQQPSAGAHFAIDPGVGASSVYVDGGLFSATATRTDALGLGGFLDVDPKTIAIHTTVPALGLELPIRSVFVRAGFVSYVTVSPRG